MDIIKNRLFIVEGIPCTGKTTTAKFISDLISKTEEKVLYYPEGTGQHPADYEFHAFISNEELYKFSEEEKDLLLKGSKKENDGYVISLANIKGELFNKIIKYKIYDMLPWEKEYPVMLNKWREFSELAGKNNYIYVFDGCLLQNPLCEMMMRFNMKPDEIKEYINKIYTFIKYLNPTVIYLENTNVKQRIEDVLKERDSSWIKEVIEYHTSQGYGKSQGYEGFNGYVECLKSRQEVELDILKSISIDKIIIENPFKNWDEAHNKIKSYVMR